MKYKESDDCEYIRKAHSRHRGELQHRHDSEDVVDEDEGEEREQVRDKSHEVMTDDIFCQVISNKAVDRFPGELKFGWYNCRFTRGEDKKERNQNHREEDQEDWLGGEGVVTENRREIEIDRARGLEAFAFS